MPEVLEIRRRARQVTIVFDEGDPVECDRGFLLTQAFSVGQTIDERILDRVREQALVHSAEAAAMRWLAARPRSKADLRRRLHERGIPAEAIAQALERLQATGRLDDEAFASAWTDDRVRLRPRSTRMIQAELRAEGVEAEVAEAVTADLDDRAMALRIAEQRLARAGDDWEKFRRQGGSALTRRGFSYAVAAEALRDAWETRNGHIQGQESPTDA